MVGVRLSSAAVLAWNWLVLGTNVGKQVLNTPWWPAGSERTAESIGILSHGFIYATAMMEYNSTLHLTVQQEINDVQDILQAGRARLEDLVDCFVNAPAGRARVLRRAFAKSLPLNGPALTVVEMPGEYSFFYASVMCVAALPSVVGELPRRVVKHGRMFGVAARGLLHIEGATAVKAIGAAAETDEVLQSIDVVIRSAGGSGLTSLIDCTVFLRELDVFDEVSALLNKRFARPVALTIVQAGSQHLRSAVTIKCTAAVPTILGKAPVRLTRTPLSVATDKHVFVSGVIDANANGTSAFATIEHVLREQKPALTLDDVVSCMFFVRNNSDIQQLFGGFYKVFNVAHFPPPARGEYQAFHSQNASVVAKCVAAFPAAVQEYRLPTWNKSTLIV